ncbi:MAG: hypothetical protein ACKVUT_03605 [Gaiella sp.]
MTGSSDPLEVAVRAYAPPPPRTSKRHARRARGGGAHRAEPGRRPPAILVLDTETTIDAAQALIVGCYRYYRLTWTPSGPELSVAKEGLFYRDDLAASDPAAYRQLLRYTAEAPGRHLELSVPSEPLDLLTRDRFVRTVLVPALSAKATVVGFNVPFDLARVAVRSSRAHASGFEGGFSLVTATYSDSKGQGREDTAVPRFLCSVLGAGRARMAFGSVRPRSDPYAEVRGPGLLLDLHTLAMATSDGKSRSLEEACELFGVHYRKREVTLGRLSRALVDYLREDVDATARLYQALATEYERWDLIRSPTRIYSGASLAKALLREARIKPLLEHQPGFSPDLLGFGMSAYYGGRSEVRIRCQPVPVVPVDVRSMHPTIAVLSRLSQFLSCNRIRITREPRAVVACWQRRLEQLTPQQCLDPALWRSLNGFALVEPDGAVLPVRARYGRRRFGIGVNPLLSDEPVWVTLADLVASALLGAVPRVRKIRMLVPEGRAQRLRPIRVRGANPIDPYHDDVFKTLVEQRRQYDTRGDADSSRTGKALKVVANSLVYGIWAELNRREPTSTPIEVPVWGLSSYTALVDAPEDLGEYFFGPLASLVTGGARLMLALLEQLVTDAGGCFAMCDTDGMAIVGTRTGGLIPCPGGPHTNEHGQQCVRALSWREVDQIARRLVALNPYDPQVASGSILSHDAENYSPTGERHEVWCYAISAKRYALYTLTPNGRMERIESRSEHGLGGIYLNPTDPASDNRDWVSEAWRWVIETDALGLDSPEPEWLDHPALSKFTATHPRLLAPFADYNKSKPYAEQVKPYGFLLVSHPTPGGIPHGNDEDRFALVAPHEADPRRWLDLEWRNLYDPTGPSYTLDTSTVVERSGHSLGPRVVGVQTYRHVLDRYRTLPEYKSLSADGTRCRRQTAGLLVRRPVEATKWTHIGKEANLLDQVAAGIVSGEEETTTTYRDPTHDEWDEIYLPVLRTLNVRETAAAVGADPSTITLLRRGDRRPRPRLRAALIAHIHAHTTRP